MTQTPRQSIRKRIIALRVNGSTTFPLEEYRTQSVRNAANFIAKKMQRAFVTRTIRNNGVEHIKVWRTK